MPSHSLDALSRSLKKGEISPVYYFHGSEDVLKDEAVRSIIERVLDPAMRDFNLDQGSAGQLDAEAIHALCNTVPMLADRRVVVLREVEAWKRKTSGRTEFLRYLEHPCPETVVILIQGSAEESEDKDLARSSYTVRFDPLSTGRAAKWLVRRAEKLGLELAPDAAEHLVRSVGPDLGALTSELAKLASLPPGEPLTAERIGELVGVGRGETLWDWRAAVLDDQSGRAVTLLPSILAQSGMSGVKVVTHLGTALIGLGIARSLYDRGLRGRELEDGVFRTLLQNRPGGLLGYREEASRWSRLVAKWPPSRLQAGLKAALEADEALKSTTISDERGVLTDLVLRLGVRSVEAA
jgi:DNA polymerase III subunit delta